MMKWFGGLITALCISILAVAAPASASEATRQSKDAFPSAWVQIRGTTALSTTTQELSTTVSLEGSRPKWVHFRAKPTLASLTGVTITPVAFMDTTALANAMQMTERAKTYTTDGNYEWTVPVEEFGSNVFGVYVKGAGTIVASSSCPVSYRLEY